MSVALGEGDGVSDLLESAKALLALDADGALVPHGLGGHGRACLEWSIAEIENLRTALKLGTLTVQSISRMP